VKLAVDSCLLHGGGIGRYLRELTARWLERSEIHEILFMGDPDELDPFLEKHDDRRVGRVVGWPGGPYSVRRHVSWPGAPRRAAASADVTFFPHYDVPLFGVPSPYVVTVHDLTHFRVPEAFPAVKRWAGWRLLRRAVKGAEEVVTVSERSRRDLEHAFPRRTPRIQVVANGVSSTFRRPSSAGADELPRSWNEKKPYLLFTGGDRPHKNLPFAIEVHRRLREEWPDLRLLVLGTIEGNGQGPDGVVELGALSDGELHGALADAIAVLIPSLYEGFGLPALEAMACGTPVVVSNRGSLPEVVGDAAKVLDPVAPEPWVQAVLDLVEKPEARTTWVQKGIERVDAFSWSKAADQTLKILTAARERRR